MSNKLNRRALLKTGAAAVGTIAAPSILSANVVFNKPMVAALNAPAGDPTNVSIARIPELMKKMQDSILTCRFFPQTRLVMT